MHRLFLWPRRGKMNKIENDTTSNLSYETAVTRLEEVVRLLEDEKMSLDRVLELYEEGSRLIKFCSKMLEQAELKIKVLDQDFYEIDAKDSTFLPVRNEVAE